MHVERSGDTPGALAPRLYYGWRVVGACFALALFGWGFGFYGPGLYLTALQARLGWSVSLVSGATTVYYLIGAALIVVVPDAMRRFPPGSATELARQKIVLDLQLADLLVELARQR